MLKGVLVDDCIAGSRSIKSGPTGPGPNNVQKRQAANEEDPVERAWEDGRGCSGHAGVQRGGLRSTVGRAAVVETSVECRGGERGAGVSSESCRCVQPAR